MSIITRKIQLNPIATELSTTTEIYKYIKNLSSELATMGNKIIRNHVNNNFNLSQIREDKKCKKSDAIEILTEYSKSKSVLEKRIFFNIFKILRCFIKNANTPIKWTFIF